MVTVAEDRVPTQQDSQFVLRTCLVGGQQALGLLSQLPVLYSTVYQQILKSESTWCLLQFLLWVKKLYSTVGQLKKATRLLT
jgi:hypothetical protein